MKGVILFFIFFPITVCGQTVINWNKELDFLNIGEQLEYFEDKSNKHTFQSLKEDWSDHEFKQSTQSIINLGYTDSYFWFRFILNNQSEDDAYLEIAQAGIPSVDFYYQLDNGEIKHQEGGYEFSIDKKSIKSSYQIFKLPKGKRTYYFKLNSNSEPIPVNIRNRQTLDISANNQKIVYGIYLGLMLFVVLNSIFLFISLRKKLYLFYALIVLIYISYSAIVIDGFIVYFIPNIDLKFLYTTIPSIGITLQTLYCLIFLEAKKHTPKLYKYVLGLIVYFSLWMVIQFFFSFPVVQPINTVHALISFFIMGFVGISVGNQSNKMGYYFASAYFIYFSLVALQAIYINTGAPGYLGGLSHVAYATLIEAFLLSFLLSKRFEWEKAAIEKERYDTQQVVIAKTIENEKIIEEQNTKLEKQVAQRTKELQQINHQLSKTNEQLVDINREKDGIINMVAHDLRSPLCTITGFIDLINRDGEINKKQDDHLSIINKVINNGMLLIDDLLYTHSLSNENKKISQSTFEIAAFMNSWMQTFDHLLIKKHQKCILKIETTSDSIYTDQLKLNRILTNIISNAIKFSKNHTTIKVHVKETKSDFVFCITDQGPGFSTDDKQKMFKRFQRLSARPTAQETSNGLGLSITKVLVELLNGQIQLKSELGNGSEFTISLPKQYAPTNK